MFDDDVPEFALKGETGIDIFHRLEDPNQRRTRFRCIATLETDGTLRDHAPEAHRDGASLWRLAQAMADDPLSAPLSLNDPASWPLAGAGGDPLRLFLYLEFLRAWQVADMAGARLEAQLARNAAALPLEPGQIAGAIAPVFDFNRLSRGVRLARAIQPVLAARIANPGFADDRHGGTGYALRMLGDLSLRADQPTLALACFETAVQAGDNPFRRRKAIEAARLAGDGDAVARHRAGYAARWELPPDLQEAPAGVGDTA